MATFGRALVNLSYSEVGFTDLEDLVEIRIAAMRPSLERLGRFDPDRARARLASNFDPAITRSIDLEGRRVGFYVLRSTDEGFSLDHLYIHPEFQGLGIGSRVMEHLISLANGPIHVGALKGSDSNRFYLRHGFEKVGADEWDVYYVRKFRG